MLQIKRRINWKIFFGLGISTTILSCLLMSYFAPGLGPQIAVLVFYVATIFNQLIIAEMGLSLLPEKHGDNRPTSASFSVMLMISKWGVLLLAVVISIQFIATEIFIPLANYLAHIAILAKSIKRLA